MTTRSFERCAPLLLFLTLPPLGRLLTGSGVLLAHDDWTSDLLHQQLPYRAFFGRSLRMGEIPTWFPDIYSGVPLAGQLESGIYYPLNALFYGLLDPIAALDISIIAHVLLGALGVYLLTRRLGADPIPAALGGIAFGLAGFNVSHLKHRNMHESAVWLPWMLWAIESRLLPVTTRLGVRGWDLALAGFVALAVLAGHPQVAWLGMAASAVRLAWSLRSAPRAVLGLSLGLSGGLLISAIGLLPQAALASISTRRLGQGFDYAAAYPYWLPDLFTFVNPWASGLYEAGTYYEQAPATSLPWESYGFVGVVTLLLAACALRQRWGWGLATGAAGLAMLGSATPLFKLLWTVAPGLRLFRFPHRFVLLVDLGLCVLAAVGLTWVVARTGKRWLALAAVLLVAGELFLAQKPRIPVDDAAYWGRGDVVSSMGSDGRVWVDEPYRYWMQSYEQSRGFKEGFSLYRLAGQVPIASRNSMQGVWQAEGYTTMSTLRTGAVWQRQSRELIEKRLRPVEHDGNGLSPAFLAHLDRAGVRWVVSHRQLGPGWTSVATEPEPVYERDQPMPRAYVATTWSSVPDIEGASAWLIKEGPRTRRPVVEGVAPQEGAEALFPVPVSDSGPDEVLLDLSGVPGGLLVLSDSFAPGWQATVDGQPAEIHPANLWQRGILIDGTAQEVHLQYQAPGLRAGAGLSLSGLLLLAGWWGLGRRSSGEDD